MATSRNPQTNVVVSRSTGEPSQISTCRDRNTLLARPDWSLLPPELVHFISKKITKMDYYVHFRFVCRAWRLSCPPNPRHIIPQLPWLWCDISRDHPSIPTLTLYDLSKSRTYKIELPYLANKRVCGHSCGWIVLEEDMKLSLINPITKEIKSNCFPSMSDPPPTVVEFAKTKKTTNSLPCNIHELSKSIRKVILSSSPSEKKCIIVVNFLWGLLGFCRTGGSHWTILEVGDCQDFKYKNDSVYVINSRGGVTIYDLRDLSQKTIVAKFPHPGNGSSMFYLVIGEGDLDGVPLVMRRVSYRASEKYQVFNWTTGSEGSSWTRVETIGNYVLLLGCYYSFECDMISLGNIGLNGWEQNHICYGTTNLVDADGSANKDGSYVKLNINMRNLENGFIKEVPTSLGYFPRPFGWFTWFSPSLC